MLIHKHQGQNVFLLEGVSSSNTYVIYEMSPCMSQRLH